MAESTIRKFIFLAAVLAVPVFFASPLTLSRAEMRGLSVSCEADTVFTHSDCSFVLSVPGVAPSSIQTDLPELPPDVKFISSKRSEFIDGDGDRGTEIRFWFSFSDAGTVTVPPLMAKIGSFVIEIPFATIVVYENPSVVLPALSVVRDDGGDFEGLRACEPVVFSVYMQYCVQILGMDAKIPKNSIFRELSREGVVGSGERRTEFSPEKFKIASFEWIPLVSGEVEFPDIQVDAIAYNGDRRRISLPVSSVIVAPPVRGQFSSGGEDVFADAFARKEEKSGERLGSISAEDIEEVRNLRCRERHSLPFSAARDERLSKELSLGIENPDDEPSVPLAFSLAALSSAMLFLFAVSVATRHVRRSCFFGIAFALSAVASAMMAHSVTRPYAIVSGGSLSLVPEESSDKVSSSRSVIRGQRARIVEHIGDWVYIDCPETGGWIPSREVLKIR